ncbi:malto-oligosyltrehalose synthase [Kushneria aurantia]|uniref:Malto-oligosyltrehalose synthase n=1 Tax=Kushneria aurantia TaxID=504092 RepID=A0ABV6FZ33_9GAMM|nr:malto-oligosyltrehalose synthase [Kushneria aurantia]
MSDLAISAPRALTGVDTPLSMMRLQFHPDFGLDAATALVDYFAALGVTHLYASPIWAARSGSTHGYDGIDPTRLNPEIGDEAALERLVAQLRAHDMGLIVDFVPNHLAVGGRDNPYWLDVLRWGRESRFADMFDVEWDGGGNPDLQERLLVPFLGTPYGEALASGDMQLAFDASSGLFHIDYFEHRFPIDPRCQALMLLEAGIGEMAAPFEQIEQALSLEAGAERAGLALAEFARSAEGKARIEALLGAYSGDSEAGCERLHALLERQHYRLAFWRTAHDCLNWRRFFDITELGGIRVEDPAVFAQTHVYLLELIERGLVDGVRLDHVDGLADPAAYCRLLRQRVDEAAARRPGGVPRHPLPIYVEKILEGNESLPEDWGVTGTTGYEFMNAISKLQHDAGGEPALSALWHAMSEREATFEEEVAKARREMIETALATEFDRAVRAFVAVARADRATRDITPGMIRRATRELAIQFPVYRSYADEKGRPARDRLFFAHALKAARAHLDPPDHVALEALDDWLGGRAPETFDEPQRSHRLTAMVRFAQFTSPLAAKAVEDTAGYRSAVLISRNDVGFDGAHFAAPVEAFHRYNARQARHFPHAMLTTATHDHKRGEDVRARLAALSELGDTYAERVRHWMTRSPVLRDGSDATGPTPGEEMMLYQIVIGAWPLALSPQDSAGLSTFAERVADWQQKALREAKLSSHWLFPDERHEAQCRHFTMALLTAPEGESLRRDIHALVERLAGPGAVNGLVQALARMTAPGVPDCYQGTERWDFSLVDPDNRRPVDFAARRAQQESVVDWPALVGDWRDGRVKQALINAVLDLRRRLPSLFLEGDYQPLVVEGEWASRVVAFSRSLGEQSVAVIMPRHVVALSDSGTLAITPQRWGNTRIQAPAEDGWRSLMGGEAVEGAQWPLSALFATLPLAVLVRHGDDTTVSVQAEARQAGVNDFDADTAALDSA